MWCAYMRLHGGFGFNVFFVVSQGYRDERVCDEFSSLIVECHSSLFFSSALLSIEKSENFLKFFSS